MYLDLIISEKVKAIIEKTCQFLLENGSEHEEYLLKSKSSTDENFGFLFQDNPYHVYYKTYWEWLKNNAEAGNPNRKFDFYEIMNRKQQKAPLMRIETGDKTESLGPAQNFQPNPIVYNLTPLSQPQPSPINNLNNNNFINNLSSQNNKVPQNFTPVQVAPVTQNNMQNNVTTSQTKKKNRWSESTSNQQPENPAQNNNQNQNTRPGNFYQQNISMNQNYPSNYYNNQIPQNQMVMPNIMNQITQVINQFFKYYE